MLLGEMQLKRKSPLEGSKRSETSCYKHWPGTRYIGTWCSAKLSHWPSFYQQARAITLYKMQHYPRERKGETWGLQTILQVRIITEHHAASPSHVWVDMHHGKSRVPLPVSKCNIPASAANKPQLLQESLALIVKFSESPAPQTPPVFIGRWK